MRKPPPPIEEQPHRHKKQSTEKKRFGIETRYEKREWVSYSWYRTAASRDQAYRSLTHRTSILTGTPWEPKYRKVER